jgi:hypothetical protein
MEFIRQNQFYVALIAVVVVVGGLLGFLNWSVSGEVDRQMKDRETLSQQLRITPGEKPVNDKVLEDRRVALGALVKGAKEAADKSVAWNKRNFTRLILSGRLLDGNMVAAFPADPNLYAYSMMDLKFSQDYMEKRAAILDANWLSVTAPPTPEEIKYRQDEIDKRSRTFVTTGPTSTPATGPSGEATAREETRSLGERSMMVRKANEGLVYLDANDLDPYFSDARKVDPARLWESQLNLWVLNDVAGAIRAANEEALQVGGAGVSQRSVVNSAVKRWMKLEVSRTYQSPMVKTMVDAGDLTKRVCTADYDVLRYKFVVIMPFRYVPLLQRKLEEQNLHTVLRIEMSTDFKEAGRLRYDYYGADPVMEVTVYGELVLLGAWERKLMPAEVLKDLKEKHNVLIPQKP